MNNRDLTVLEGQSLSAADVNVVLGLRKRHGRTVVRNPMRDN